MKITLGHVALGLGAAYLLSQAMKKGGALGQGWEGADPWGGDVKIPYGEAFTTPEGKLAARYADPSSQLRSAFTTAKIPLPGYYAAPTLDPWGISTQDALAISEAWRTAQWSQPDWYGTAPDSYGGWGSAPEPGYLYGTF